MYYSVNTRMHINLSMRSCNGNLRKTRFKVDTGADGSLLPLAEFFKHFPDANLNDLARTVDPNTKLYAYNDTKIKQASVSYWLNTSTTLRYVNSMLWTFQQLS